MVPVAIHENTALILLLVEINVISPDTQWHELVTLAHHLGHREGSRFLVVLQVPHDSHVPVSDLNYVGVALVSVQGLLHLTHGQSMKQESHTVVLCVEQLTKVDHEQFLSTIAELNHVTHAV